MQLTLNHRRLSRLFERSFAMKRLALLAAAGMISMLPSIASARPFFFWGFRFGAPVPVVVPIIPPPAVVVAPPVVAAAPVVVAGPGVVYGPVHPAYYYHPGYYYGYGHPYFYRHWGFARYHYWR
jgi:hypothetical protein